MLGVHAARNRPASRISTSHGRGPNHQCQRLNTRLRHAYWDGRRAWRRRSYPLDAPTVRRLGAALVRALPRGSDFSPPRLLVGRDTRESGSWIEAELACGASGERAVVTSAGVVPTPAVAYLTRSVGYDAGIVISASHNPFADNGIKVFSGKGEKFTESVEREVEEIVADASWAAAAGQARAVDHGQRLDAYLDHLRAVFPEASDLRDFKLVVDCANGATSVAAPELFASLGIDAFVIGSPARWPEHQSGLRVDTSNRWPMPLSARMRHGRGIRWRRLRDLREPPG